MRLRTKKQNLGRPLGPKERQTWKLIAQGLSTKEIAKKRQVSVRTVETVRSVLLSKLGAHNTPTLIAMWYRRTRR